MVARNDYFMFEFESIEDLEELSEVLLLPVECKIPTMDENIALLFLGDFSENMHIFVGIGDGQYFQWLIHFKSICMIIHINILFL